MRRFRFGSRGLSITSLRRIVCVAGIVLIAVGFAGYDAARENPTVGVRTWESTKITVRILRVDWHVTGCTIANATSPSTAVPANSSVTETVRLTNDATATNCTLETGAIAPASFGLAPVGFPQLLAPGSSASVTVDVLVPPYATPTNLSIALIGD